MDLSAYSSNEYTGFQLHEIRLGLEHKVNVSLYDDLGFSWEQMRQIRKGLEDGLDVSLYADLLYSDAQMREIRLGLENDLNVLSYAKLIYSKTDMHKMRTELFAEKYAVDPESFAKTIVDPESGAVIRFTDDLMEAYVRLPQGCKLNENALYAMLEDNDVVYGYVTGNISELAEKGSEAGILLAAKGDRIQKGCDGSYKMLWRKFEPPTPYERSDGTMDFATVDFVDMVKTGQPIAVYTPLSRAPTEEPLRDLLSRKNRERISRRSKEMTSHCVPTMLHTFPRRTATFFLTRKNIRLISRTCLS